MTRKRTSVEAKARKDEQKLIRAQQKIVAKMRTALHEALRRELFKPGVEESLVQAWVNRYPYRVDVTFLVPVEDEQQPAPTNLVDLHGAPLGQPEPAS